MLTLVALLAVTGASFFLIRAVQMQIGYRSMGRIETQRAEMEAARARAERLTIAQRMRAAMDAVGYDGDIFPFAAGLAFLYLALVTALAAFGVPYWVAYISALPVAGTAVWVIAKWAATQRRTKFNEQLVDMLEMVAGQIEGGTGALRAMNLVAGTLPEPIRSEMIATLDESRASKDLIGAMRRLSERYPSRALSLYIAALEIDQNEGHSIGPAIRQAAEDLHSDFQLRSEANAEISQQRGEFFIILGVMGAIAGYMMFGGDGDRVEAYNSPVGFALILAGLANVGWGIWRVMRMLNTIKGEDLG